MSMYLPVIVLLAVLLAVAVLGYMRSASSAKNLNASTGGMQPHGEDRRSQHG